MLDERTRRLAGEANFATLTTLMPDGHPQTHVVWVDTDGEQLRVNTEVHRQKFSNMETDPRVTVTIIDRDDPYSHVEVRGKVVEMITGERAREHIDELSRKYLGRDYPNRIQSERVMVLIEPYREVVH